MGLTGPWGWFEGSNPFSQICISLLDAPPQGPVTHASDGKSAPPTVEYYGVGRGSLGPPDSTQS